MSRSIVALVVFLSACTSLVEDQLESKTDAAVVGSICTTAASCGDCALACVDGRCQSTTIGAPDGTMCEPTRLCVSRVCVEQRCGDRFVDRAAGEYCDDGNATEDDGCTTACARSCEAPSDCDDGDSCQAESCEALACAAVGDPMSDGTACTDSRGRAGTCQSGRCAL